MPKKAEGQVFKIISPQENIIMNLKKFISGATQGSFNKQIEETVISKLLIENQTKILENNGSLHVFHPAKNHF